MHYETGSGESGVNSVEGVNLFREVLEVSELPPIYTEDELESMSGFIPNVVHCDEMKSCSIPPSSSLKKYDINKLKKTIQKMKKEIEELITIIGDKEDENDIIISEKNKMKLALESEIKKLIKDKKDLMIDNEDLIKSGSEMICEINELNKELEKEKLARQHERDALNASLRESKVEIHSLKKENTGLMRDIERVVRRESKLVRMNNATVVYLKKELCESGKLIDELMKKGTLLRQEMNELILQNERIISQYEAKMRKLKLKRKRGGD